MLLALACAAPEDGVGPEEAADSLIRAEKSSDGVLSTGPISAQIDSIAHAALKRGSIAGMSIAVMQGPDVAHARGYGVADIEARAPAHATTVYNIASVAKIIAAAAVLKLVEEGRVGLEDDLTSLLPDFPNPEQGRGITLRQLLNHTSGLNDYVSADVKRWHRSGKPLTPAFVLDYLRDRPLDFDPRTNWIYSNTGFYLAGLIVERMTGRSWGDYVLDSVARPLGLHSIALCDDVASLRAKGYDVIEDGFAPSREDAEEGVRGDAGLCSTVLDLARLPGALLRSGLLSTTSLNELLSPTVLANSVAVDYGLGVALGSLDGHPLWGHLGGDVSSYIATLAHYPEDDVTVAVLVNTRRGDVGALVVAGEVARVVLDLGPPTLADHSLTPEAQRIYMGTYVGDRGAHRFRVISDDERIARMPVGTPSSKLPLLNQGAHAFGRSDWLMDRFVFHIVGERAVSYAMYYNGVFDGFYLRVGP